MATFVVVNDSGTPLQITEILKGSRFCLCKATTPTARLLTTDEVP